MSRLVLIDGSSYLFRAFHALPPLTAPDGSPTGALFGIVNMLRATLKENPDYVAFVLDASGPTFRDALYPEYKATRSAMPDDLRAQVEPMKQIVEALGFPILCVPGVEADDVIGTLAVQAHAAGIPVDISTGDKDFAQLVRPGITLTNTMSGSVLDEAGVVAKFGVRPEQIVDFLALMGDTVDNIRGVDKCGPKTAAKWLGEYGTLDAVIANADRIGGKIGENLRAVLERLPLNRTLVTIKQDVALEQAPQQLKLKPRDVAALSELYARYGFHAALRELTGGETGAPGGGARPLEAGRPAVNLHAVTPTPSRSRSAAWTPYCVYWTRRASMSRGRSASAAGPRSSATSVLIVTSVRFSGRRSSAARRFSPILPPMRSAAAITASSVPCSPSHFAAVFGPHLSTPGTLSTVSPISASRSTIWSGRTPNFANTAASSSTLPVIVLTSVMPGRTSCAKSLSPVEIVTSMPAACACTASVPITSSASTPSTHRIGKPSASTMRIIGCTCARRSSGIGARVAL